VYEIIVNVILKFSVELLLGIVVLKDCYIISTN